MNVTINVGIVGIAGEQHCTCVHKFISCKWMNIMTDKIWYRQNVEIRNLFLWPAERTSFRHWAHEWWRLLTGVSLVLEFISWNICCSAASDSKSALKSSTAILFKSFSIQNGGGKLNHICTDGLFWRFVITIAGLCWDFWALWSVLPRLKVIYLFVISFFLGHGRLWFNRQDRKEKVSGFTLPCGANA